MPARQTVRVLEISDDGAFVRSDRGWIARDELRVATRVTPPAGTGAEERWLDIDLDEQVLVAYVGARPVYATLVSTGRRNHDTPTGVFRIERKVAERTMNSRADDDEPYAVDRVPWTAYFADSFALHAAYWHGSFGERKSHGCVNLSPVDARMLYRWSAPAVAPGWSEVYGHAEQPGSLVRIHSSDDPQPSFRGYAAELGAAAG
ncbi:MAG: L,D-transpeptidase [Deltaproteobacteria bacterium]|nr:L,D-transpeptidase [Nannocystaceae bacterium]